MQKYIDGGDIGMITKKDLSKEVWGRVKGILRSRKISQVRLSELCKEQGYQISQPEISRLNSGEGQLTLYQLLGVSKALNMSVDQIVYPDNLHTNFQVVGGAFITDPDDASFAGYMGTYYTIFHSTEMYSDKFLKGKLVFEKDGVSRICKADFELHTGEINKKKTEFVKKYKGQLVISKLLDTAYCLLFSEQMGEICSLEFRHRAFLIKEVQCRLGMVLTVSSGEVRKPVAHRIFLCRTPIDSQWSSRINPFLKLTVEDKEVLISKTELEKLSQDKSYAYDFNALIEKINFEEYARISYGVIKSVDLRLSNYELGEAFAAIRDKTGVYNSYIEEADDSQAFNMLQRFGLEEEK
jgi:hypothetical protein